MDAIIGLAGGENAITEFEVKTNLIFLSTLTVQENTMELKRFMELLSAQCVVLISVL